MMQFPHVIMLLITACATDNPNHCREHRIPTLFASEHQCQVLHQQALAEWQVHFPKYRAARWKCELVSNGEET